MSNMLRAEQLRGFGSRRSVARRRISAWLLALMGGAGFAPAMASWAPPSEKAGGDSKSTERLVFSLPNGVRVEREVPKDRADTLIAPKARRGERAAATWDDGRDVAAPGPRDMGAAPAASSTSRSSRDASSKTVLSRSKSNTASAAHETVNESGRNTALVPSTEREAQVAGWVPDRNGGGRYAESQPARIPDRPTNFRVVDNGAAGAELSWVSVSSNQTAFMIERQPPFSDRLPRFAGPGQTVWVDESGAGTFTYTIRAINEDARSAPTDPVEVVVASNAVSTPPLMIPGIGWADPTPEPTPVGSSGDRGYDAKSIARFDVVPNMIVEGHIDVGVVAFHMNGIQRVDFAVEGGPWTSVTQMTLNAQAGVWEYVARVQQVDFNGGQIEIRAIAYPNTGIPRVLNGLKLYVPRTEDGPRMNMYVSVTGSDSTGTGTREQPYRSINKAAKEIEIRQNGRADGGVINLMAGDYSWGPAGRDAEGRWISYPVTEQRYLTVQPMPPLGKRDVRIIDAPGGGLRTKLVHVRNVTVVGCQLDNAQPTNDPNAVIWVHGCTFMGPDIIHAVRWVVPEAYPGGIYVTNTVVRDAAEGWSRITMLRGCTIDAIGDDAFVNCDMVVNCEVRNIVNPDGTGFHSDVLQYHAQETPFDNIIVYNLRAVNNVSQAWNVGYTRRGTGPAWSNMAFVNVVIEQSPDGYSSSWAADANHVLWWNMTIPVGFVFLIDHPDVQDGVYFPTRIHNFSVRGSVFHKFNLSMTSGEPSLADTSWADNNHFIDVTSHGTQTAGTRFTTGGLPGDLFASPVNNDFSAKPGSALCNREVAPLMPNDSMGRRTGAFRAVGAMQPLQP